MKIKTILKFSFIVVVFFTTLSSSFQCTIHEDPCSDLREHIKKRKKIGL